MVKPDMHIYYLVYKLMVRKGPLKKMYVSACVLVTIVTETESDRKLKHLELSPKARVEEKSLIHLEVLTLPYSKTKKKSMLKRCCWLND